jgi:hypothetical protein
MPIRINLLAETLAAEDMRRRDPVQRAIVVAVLLVAAMLVWASSLSLKSMLARSDLAQIEAQMGSRTNTYRHVLDDQRQLAEFKGRLSALQHLATNRFLNGTMLNALQHVSADDLRLLRLKTEQTYTAPAAPATASGSTPAPPQTVTEHIVLTLDASDSSPNPGDQIGKFKDMVASNAYFQDMLEHTNAVALKSYSLPQISHGTGRPCVQFTLECRYPDKTR